MKDVKTKVTLSIHTEALQTMLQHYCGQRQVGEFLSQLVMDYHARRQGNVSAIARELQGVAEQIDKVPEG